MKKFLALFFVTTFSASSFAQSYSDLFTTYKPAPTVPNGSVYVPKMEVMDPSKYTQKRRSQAEEQLQIITGVYVKNGQFRGSLVKPCV
jgi:TorA maturation chaperone TorD